MCFSHLFSSLPQLVDFSLLLSIEMTKGIAVVHGEIDSSNKNSNVFIDGNNYEILHRNIIICFSALLVRACHQYAGTKSMLLSVASGKTP